MTNFKMHARRSVLAAALILFGLGQSAVASESARYLVSYNIGAKDAVMTALPAEAQVHHAFDHLGLIAVSMPSEAVDTLAQVTDIVDISEDPLRYLSAQQVPYGIDMVHAREAWDADRDGNIDSGAATGEGVRICVVDTGIYAANEDLGGGGVQIVDGKSFVDENWAEDRQGHGTHVAGTIAAMNNERGVVGVSPGTVELLIADVFNDDGDGQASSTILAAAEWCADNGADIISMSLGGPLPSDAIAAGYQDIYDRGVLIIAAAGNDSAPIHNYPASYPSVASVAALDSTETVADFSNFPVTAELAEVEVAAPGVGVLSTYPFENSLSMADGTRFAANSLANTPTGSASGPLMDGGLCSGAAAPGQFDGAIVLCERGGGTFGSKVDYAYNGGAVGAAIYNNEPGNFSGTYGQIEGPIPAVSLSQEDGKTAQAFHVGNNATVLVEAESTSGYAALSGTSMATPHASAVAAVHWSACRDLDNDEVRSHLTATTRDAMGDLIAGRDPWYGFGLVQVKEGIDALSDGIDEYDRSVGNADGNRPANVECAATVGADDAFRAKGHGWLRASEYNQKITFSFKAENKSDALKGKLKLKDKVTGAEIKVDELTTFTELAGDCGPIAAGSNAVEITGHGTFNEAPARFKACAADNGKKGKGIDQFYLECTAGCSYNTAASDGTLRGGHIKIYAPKD